MKLEDITLGIITKDRYERLLPLLRSVSILEPFKVLVIDNSPNSMVRQDFEGEFTELGITLRLLEWLGFDIGYQVRPFMTSMFQLRNLLLEECRTKYLWVIDDDVEFVGNPLKAYLEFPFEPFGYLQGSKVDNRNTEGYKDYAVFKNSLVTAPGDIPCWYYYYDSPACAPTCVLDCGNALINVACAKEVGGFTHPTERGTKEMTGEDILMGARLSSKYMCFFLSSSKVLHFPKQKMRFKTKDPKWLWPTLEKECSREVLRRLREFYDSKFDWSGTHVKG